MTMRRLFASLLVTLSLASCDGEEASRPVTIDLEGRVGERAFECGAAYEGIGTTGSTFTAFDFRFYVHDVRVVLEGGEEVPLTLDDDGVWQTVSSEGGGIALIDFEDGDGCEGGNAPMNTRLVGTIPDRDGAITGVRFRIGVPEARNHLDSATAPSPMNLSSMYWGWQGGYKYVRIEGASTGQSSWLLHVGATGCSGDARMGTRTCTARNEASIALDGFDPARDVIVADLASMLATSDVDADAGGAPGCMSDADDPECAVLFDAIGVSGDAQSLFRVEARNE
ncbi:MbnP family copper-binding protein [Sandaracinus amylolyticus]|uniref:MbnP family copper-binding protein n=1 Tax=Sandaracinus amylolyticus TaxID=927083 RepID=UPI001F427A43|nr:MbnP family copper-binding protein [Sandaracinus amylolyticus]